MQCVSYSVQCCKALIIRLSQDFGGEDWQIFWQYCFYAQHNTILNRSFLDVLQIQSQGSAGNRAQKSPNDKPLGFPYR